jgi:hypothetical protein
VASPVVAGTAALVLSAARTISKTKFQQMRNIAAVKQVLMSSADVLPNVSLFQQGSGVLNMTRAYHAVQTFEPHVILRPQHISNMDKDCPSLWPYCSQRIYATGQPFVANFTVLNSRSLTDEVIGVTWHEHCANCVVGDKKYATYNYTTTCDISHSIDGDDDFKRRRFSISNAIFSVDFQLSALLWPYSGYISTSIRMRDLARTESIAKEWSKQGVQCKSFVESVTIDGQREAGRPNDALDMNRNTNAQRFTGVVHVNLHVNLSSGARKQMTAGSVGGQGEADTDVSADVSVGTATMRLEVVPTPPRHRRLLWDTFHTIYFPSAFIPRDDLSLSR